MIGFKLTASSESIYWWRHKWSNSIHNASNDTGYVLKRINKKRRTATFVRDDNKAASVKIPDAFLRGKLPADAATELTNFFEYLRNKYGF
jgi:hypothetical protein